MKGRLLVIDDEKAFCSFLRCVFNQADYIVETAKNGTEGLERARTETFDLIITDMIMPGLSGAEFIARVRADGNEVPIIAITAYTPDEIRLCTVKNHRLDVVLYKPFSAKEVRDAVEAALTAEIAIKAMAATEERCCPFNNCGL